MPVTGHRPPALPAPRHEDGVYRIALVCLGNICRSPMADVVLNDRLVTAGLDRHVRVVSAGTGDWHVGNPMDRRAAALLTSHGYDTSAHRAQQFTADWFDEHDLILAMDTDNIADLRDGYGDRLDDPGRLMLFREFDPRAAGSGDREVPDPYYGGDDGFVSVLAMIERTCDGLVAVLNRELVGG